jgi:hypothetical protein
MSSRSCQRYRWNLEGYYWWGILLFMRTWAWIRSRWS